MEVISCYTSKDGIADGILHEPYKDWPAALISNTVKVEIEGVKDGRKFDQICRPLMWDAIMEARANPTNDLITLEHTAIGTVWVRPNELGGLTVMKPEDN